MSIKKNETKYANGQTFKRGDSDRVKVTEHGKSITHTTTARANLAINQGKKV